MRTVVKALLPIVVTLFINGVASACPNCKEAVANQQGSDAARVSKGYAWSILMMIGMPLGMVTTGVVVVARAVKRGVLPEM